MLADLRNQACCGHYHTEGDELHKLGAAGAAAVLAALLAHINASVVLKHHVDCMWVSSVRTFECAHCSCVCGCVCQFVGVGGA